MRIIFHIGMGKTGTSSIQNALASNAETLAAQNACYLGMWFSVIDPGFQGLVGQRNFLSSDADEMRDHADRFQRLLKQRAADEGIDTFILSYEGIFGSIARFAPFLDALRAQVPVSLIAYLRDPNSWLPSAYSQWGIRHKHRPGPIRPYAEQARNLIGQYEGIRQWVEKYSDILTVRDYEACDDVVTDFAQATGLRLETGTKRHLERGEPAELLLRALYNNRFADPVLPDRFNNTVINPNQGLAPSVQEMAARCFDFDGTDEIVNEKRALFEFIRDRVGIDYLDSSFTPPGPPDQADLQRRLIDYLTEITLNQAQRLKRLERIVAELRDAK